MSTKSRVCQWLCRTGPLFVTAILTLGCGGITATALDALGPDLSTINLTILSGQNQNAVSGGGLPNPILVRIDRNGAPWPNTRVVYEVAQQFSPRLPDGTSSKSGAIGGAAESNSQGIATINPRFDAGTGTYSVSMYYYTCSVYYIGSCPPEKLVHVGTVSVSGAVLAGP